MEDPRDPHVEPQHPDQAVGHTTDFVDVPADESGVSGVACEIKKMTNGSAVLAMKPMLMVRKVVWVRRRRRVPSLKRRNRSKISKGQRTRPK